MDDHELLSISKEMQRLAAFLVEDMTDDGVLAEFAEQEAERIRLVKHKGRKPTYTVPYCDRDVWAKFGHLEAL